MKNYIAIFRELKGEETERFDRIVREVEQEEINNENIGLDDIYKEVYEERAFDNGEPETLREKKGTLLIELVNRLNREELTIFLEDIFTEEAEDLVELFSGARQITVSEKAFDWICELPHNTYLKVSEQMDHIMEKALNTQFENSEIVIKNIIALTIYLKRGLSSLFIQTSVREKELGWKQKLDLLIALSRLEDQNLDADYWDKEIDVLKYPYLAPAILSAFSEAKNPREGLLVYNKLDQLRPPKLSKIQQSYFLTYTKWPLFQLVRMNNFENINWIKKFYFDIKKEWIRNLFNEIFEEKGLELLQQTIEDAKNENQLTATTIVSEEELQAFATRKINIGDNKEQIMVFRDREALFYNFLPKIVDKRAQLITGNLILN